MKKIKWIALITLVVFLLISTSANAFYSPLMKNTLRGIKSIHILVGLSSSTDEYRVTKERIQTDVELKLRLAGIKVLTTEDLPNTPQRAILIVDVNLFLSGNIFASSVQVNLMQEVDLKRDNTVNCLATTWTTGSTGIARTDMMSKTVYDEVKTA